LSTYGARAGAGLVLTRRSACGDRATLEAIAEALGLKKAHASERQEEIAATRVPSLEGIVLQNLLAHLPAPEFDLIAPALLAVLEAQPSLDDDTVAQSLASRLGRLGTPSIPLLEQMIFSKPKRPFRAAIHGLCRVGAEAAPLAERCARLPS
jgi:hypothetical protein